MQLSTQFGDHLKHLRTTRSLTQEALAARSGLAVDSIRRLERGAFSPSLDTLAKLTTGLQISIKTLFDGFERKRPRALSEICDFLSYRNDSEIAMVSRVVRAMLSD